jgi:predicted RNA-binding Zn-ribbon protein involved in translation (DUF1610 family)
MKNKVEAALAIGEKYGVVARKPEIHENLVAATRICAVHGRPWVALYEPKTNGHYKLKDCARVTGAGASGGGTAKEIPLSLIDGRWLHAEKCPWCGSEDMIRCGNCNAFVCGGRVKGDAFTCYDACGFRGTLSGSYSSFTGVSQPSPAAARATQTPGAARAALPTAQRPQLSPGGK